MVYIPTKIQVADILTKALGYQVFSVHLDTLFGIPPVKQLKEYIRVIDLQRRAGVKVPMYKGELNYDSEDEVEEEIENNKA